MGKCWFDQLTAQQLKELAQAATLPGSGSKAKLQERLVACDDTNQFGYVPDKGLWGSNKVGPEMTVSEIKNICQQQGVSKTGNRYELVLRLLNKKFGATTNKKESALPKKELTGDALQKRVTHRRQKLHKQLDSKFKWKSSYKYDRSIKGGRVSIDCPEKEVVEQMFDNLKETKGKLSKTFATDEDIAEDGLYGKSYRFGAQASLKAPASIIWKDGKLSFTFKYQVQC